MNSKILRGSGLAFMAVMLAFLAFLWGTHQQQESVEISKVVLTYEDEGTEEHMFRRADVDRFMDASIKLHYEPGINPHNNGKTARLAKIDVYNLQRDASYWWTTPDLQNNADPNGAVVYDWGLPTESWRPPQH